tara:strand:- start:4306 stop:7371 length:3066 start_codon:yes stop_codon:yes gene_type:complete
MSKSLFLPTAVLEEAELEGHTTASQALGSRGTMEFVNSSLSTIQTFFARMIQLDPAEDELFGETGRDVNGFRLTTEDEPAGVDHDTAISIRSDHISALGIQSGKGSTSDALLCMGTWDGSDWGVNGALRIDMSDSNAFVMESNYGAISFDNNSTNRRLTADIYNLKIGTGTQHAEFQDLETGNPALFFYNGGDPGTPSNGAVVYAKGGDLYRMKSDSSVDEWGAGGSGGSGFDPSSTQTITGDWTFRDATFQPASSGAPFAIGSNGDDQLVDGLNADLLDGQHGSYYAALSEAETVTGVYAFQPGSGTVPFTTNKTGIVTNLNADKVDGYSGSELAVLDEAETITGVYAFQPSSGTVPFTTNKTGVVTNLNADKLDGYTGDDFGVLAEDETISGSWTVSSGETFKIDGTLGATSNLTVKPGGDLLLDPDGRDVLPVAHYDINLGSLSKNYLSLHVAELWVQTLVAQETIATIGGRILVGPTTELINDYSAGGSTIDVKHNEMSSGDIVYMQKFDGSAAQIEFFSIDSGASTITDGYRYDVTGNLDGTGANNWLAGDAVFNTQQSGEGFIDLYSIAGVNSGRGGTPTTYGPTIVGNVRNSATYNDWTEHWAVGNLNGLYGYSGNTMAVGLGKKTVEHLTIDTTDGMRFFGSDGTTVRGQFTGSDVTLGDTSGEHLAISTSALNFKNSSTVLGSLTASAVTLGQTANDHIVIDSSASSISFKDSSTVLSSMTPTAVTLGQTSNEHLAISTSAIDFKDGSTVMASLTSNTWVLGQTGSSNQNIEITTSGINLRSNETNFAEFGLTTAAPFLKFTDSGSSKYWELKKDYNNNNFTVRPQTDSIFKFMDEGGNTTSLGIDTADTTFNSVSKANNSIVTQHMGRTSGMPVNSVIGGTDETYNDGDLIDLFGFTLATSQMMYCDLTIISWSPAATQEVQAVSRWRIITYKDQGGNVYPALAGEKVDEVEAWREVSVGVSDTVAIAAGGGTNEYKVTLDREFTGTVSTTRIVYKADIIGTVTAITNLQV